MRGSASLRMAAIGQAGVVDLEPAAEPRPRQIEQSFAVLKDQPALLLEGQPILPGDRQRRAPIGGHPPDLGQRFLRLRSDDGRDAGFQDAGLLAGDQGKAVAQIFLVVESDGGDDR